MTVTADEMVGPFMQGMGLLASGVPGGYQRSGHGVVLNVLGLPAASTNTITFTADDASPADAEAFADECAAAGLPFILRARPVAPEWVPDFAARRGLGRAVQFPIMVLEEADLSERARQVGSSPGLVEVDPSNAGLLARVAVTFTEGNETPPGLYEPIVGRPMVEQTDVGVYAACDGDDVTSVGIRLQVPGAVGVFGIATPPAHRRRGLGEAVTARVVADGFRRGARWAFLGATPMGLGIYERLGFRIVEEWTFHVPG